MAQDDLQFIAATIRVAAHIKYVWAFVYLIRLSLW